MVGVGAAQRKAQGNSQKVSDSPQNLPPQVFEAALRVAGKLGYTSDEVDRKAQVISFSIGPVGKAGSDHLTAFFHGLPDGCGSEDKVCTATKVEVKRCVTFSCNFWREQSGMDDENHSVKRGEPSFETNVTAFFKPLQEELSKSSAMASACTPA